MLAAACGREAPDAPAGRAAASAAPPAISARVAAVRAESVTDAVETVGTVRSKTQTLIASRVQGYVREVRARQGDLVESGTLLVLVDQREPSTRVDRAASALSEAQMGLEEVLRMLDEAEASLRAVEADRVYADATARRYRELWERQFISAQDYEAADAKRKSTDATAEQARARIRSLTARREQMRHRIDQARAELRTAEIELGDTRITAPATGVVVDRRAEPGDLAMPGQPLLVLDDPRAYRLEAEVGESAIGRVRMGQTVPVVLDSLARTVDGRVAEIIPAADPTSRTVLVKLDIPGVPALRSGVFGRARFPAGERQTLIVPASALVARGQLTGVYVVDEQSVARLRLVTAGARRGEGVEILSGLAPGERIVVDRTAQVSDGARVAPAP